MNLVLVCFLSELKLYDSNTFRVGKVDLDINDKIDKPIEESSEGFKAVTPVVETKTSKAKNLGTPYIEVTPALDQEQEQVKKPRRLANLVTSWGPGVVKTKTGAGGKTRTSPHVAPNGPKLPPKSDYVKQQQTGQYLYAIYK